MNEVRVGASSTMLDPHIKTRGPIFTVRFRGTTRGHCRGLVGRQRQPTTQTRPGHKNGAKTASIFIYLLKCFSSGVPLYNEISATH